MPPTERDAMSKKIWISRDEEAVAMLAWTSKPRECDGEWNEGNNSCEFDCSEGKALIKIILGDAWSDAGSLCAEIEIGSVKILVSYSELVAGKLRKMTKATFRKATINEAIKLLE